MTAWSSILFQSTLPLRGATTSKPKFEIKVQFQSTFPLRGATRHPKRRSDRAYHFNPRSPLRGATRIPKELWDNYRISIHVPLAGSDSFGKRISACRMISIHVPLAGSDGCFLGLLLAADISIHVPLAGSDDKVSNELRDLWISIHVPLAGSDPLRSAACGAAPNFNPRSPCGERRQGWSALYSFNVFQSTFPLRGATRVAGGRGDAGVISIHAPLAGSDDRTFRLAQHVPISIHAPLAGSDCRKRPPSWWSSHFNPRSPCGERPVVAMRRCPVPVFQSTLPLRGTTRHIVILCMRVVISIHAPLAGSDGRSWCGLARVPDFNPRSPCGERLQRRDHSWRGEQFQSTLPLRGATWSGCR